MKTNTLLTALLGFILLNASCKKESVIPAVTNTDAASLTCDHEPDQYPFCLIGDKKWMSVNLTTSFFRNGERIPECKTAKKWAKLTTPAWCWPRFDSVHNWQYGKLYNFYAVADLRNLAPKGWHIPRYDEMLQLEAFAGGSLVAGGLLKEQGLDHWLSPNYGATDVYGFSARGAGYTDVDGFTPVVGAYAVFWVYTYAENNTALAFSLLYNNPTFNHVSPDDVGYAYGVGLSVRCIKNK